MVAVVLISVVTKCLILERLYIVFHKYFFCFLYAFFSMQGEVLISSLQSKFRMRRKLKLSNDLILEVLQFTSRSDLDYYVLLSRRIRQLIDTHFAYFPMRQAESISLTREGSGETFALRGDLRDQPSCLLFEGNFAQSFSISTDAIRASFVDKVKVLSTERRESVHYASWMSLMSTIEHARIQELAFVNMDFTNIPVELFQRLSFASFATLYLRDCLLRAAHLNNGFLRFLKKPEINLVLSNITPSDGDFFELDGEEIIEFCSKSDAQVGNVQRRLNAHHVTLSSGFFTRLIQV